jgi:hypothetical protein
MIAPLSESAQRKESGPNRDSTDEIETRVRHEARCRQEAEDRLIAARSELRAVQAEAQSLRLQLDQIFASGSWKLARLIADSGNRIPAPLQRLMLKTFALLWRVSKWGIPTLRSALLLGSRTPAELFRANSAPRSSKLALERFRRLAIFKPDHYAKLHADVRFSGVDPYAHALHFGSFEGRQLFRRDQIARTLGRLAAQHSGQDQLSHFEARTVSPDVIRQLPCIGIYVSSCGNVFMRELAGDLVADLTEAGVAVELNDESSSIDQRPPICIFVAPHEFFILGRGKAWIRNDVLSSSFLYATEQMQTSWFALSLPFLLTARGVIDIAFQTASVLGQASLAALHLEPSARRRDSQLTPDDLSHPLYRALPASARVPSNRDALFIDRPIDISFFGAASPHREVFFARHASSLAAHQAFFYCRRHDTPIGTHGTEASLTRIAAHVSAHSKISLNLHRDEFDYFEWHRMVRLAISARSVVVSEPCLPHPHFQAGVHYFEENARQIPNLVAWLLRSPEGQRRAEEAIRACEEVISNQLTPHRVASLLAKFVMDHKQNS